jgi:hypothetical protein
VTDVVGHEPPRWPRPPRLVLIGAAVAVVVAAGVWFAVAGTNSPRSGARLLAPSPTEPSSSERSVPASPSVGATAGGPPVSVPASAPVAASRSPSPPPVLIGPAPHNTGVRALLVPDGSLPTARPGIFVLDSGQIVPVRGLPVGGCLTTGARIPASDAWAVVWQPVGNGSQACASGAGRLYVVDAAEATARLIGRAEFVAPADHGSLWTVTDVGPPPSPAATQSPQRVQRVTLTGAVLGPAYRLPDGWTLSQGLTPDMLLLSRQLQTGPDNWQVWRPSTRADLGEYEHVLAADANVLAWVANSCAPDTCPVHLSAPTGGADSTVFLPHGAYAFEGSLNSDSTYLALDLGSGVDANGATNRDTGVIVDLTTRKVHIIEQTKIPSNGYGGLALNWANREWLAVEVPGGSGISQLGAYNPTTGAFVVSQHALPAGLSPIF